MIRQRSTRRLCVALAVVALSALSTPLAAAVAEPTRQRPQARELAGALATVVTEWLPPQLKARGVPGGAAVVVDRGGIVWEQVYGVTGDPESSAVTPDTVFCIRSISKSVTALGVLVAVQEGLVDLDTPISKYLPDFQPPSRFDPHPEALITLRHLLAHRAGLTHDPPAGLDLDRSGYFRRYVDRISGSWLRYPVGYRFHYSNQGVDLAGYVLEVRSGKPFADYLREKVLEPLGMSRSTFDLEQAGQRRDRAIGHGTGGDTVALAFPEIPAAGLYSSIRDMARYARFHLNGGELDGRRLLREDLMEQYHAIQFTGRGQRTGYAFGLWREVLSNTYSLYAEGGGRGFGSHLIVYPELGAGVVLLTNREYHGLTGYEGRTIVNGPIINRFGPLPVAEPGLDRMRRLDLDDPRLPPVLGRYGDSPGMVIGFENGVLGLRMGKSSFAPLTFYDDGGELVAMYGSLNEIRFLPPMGTQPGSMMTVSRSHSNSNSHYLDFNDSPLDPPGPARPEWQQYVGEYDVIWEDLPSSTASVTIRNGYLYFRDGKCRQHEPGLVFLYDGEALDFRSVPLTFAGQEIRKRSPR